MDFSLEGLAHLYRRGEEPETMLRVFRSGRESTRGEVHEALQKLLPLDQRLDAVLRSCSHPCPRTLPVGDDDQTPAPSRIGQGDGTARPAPGHEGGPPRDEVTPDVCSEPVDMRLFGFERSAARIRDELKEDPRGGSLFAG